MYNHRVRTILVGLVLILAACCAVTTAGADAAATGVNNAQPASLQAHAPAVPTQGSNPLSGSDASIVEFSFGIGVLFTGIALFGLRAYRRQPGAYYVHPFRGR